MKKRRLKKKPFILLGIVLFFCLSILSSIMLYKYEISPISNKSYEVDFVVESGNNFYSIGRLLKKEGLIRSEFFYKIYIKLNKSELKLGTYKLNKNMSIKKLVSMMSSYSKYNPNAVNITFKEGKNMRSIANTIASKTNNTTDEVYALLKDKTYLNELINKYWFIDESILNDNLYYSLEGYLYPDTYKFSNKDVKVKEIFDAMLHETDVNLTKYKTDILNNTYSVHEILTMASIVELEGASIEDRNNIARVFYNRLKINMNLGSDVTTYYASKVDMSERDLYTNELNDKNNYNTRSTYLNGKLPIGPICNPSISSVLATLYPSDNSYYYFIADKNKKVYFSETSNEQTKKKNELIEAGLWYMYD